MTFVTALALAGVLFVALPYFAHRLRRRRAPERPFAAVRLVPPSPPRARRRSELDDRALFAVRTLSVVALAILGASPLVRCSRLTLERSQGASVALAIVLDDSMSMRAPLGSQTRFQRARRGALELLATAREGDAVALVLAGKPARVALAATTDLRAAKEILERATESDRATDLEGGLGLAQSLLASLPQVDKRTVLLSDLADGSRRDEPLGLSDKKSDLWIPLPELRGDLTDCAVLAATRAQGIVRAAIACGPGKTAAGREVELVSEGKVLAKVPGPPGEQGEVTLSGSPEVSGDLTVRLTGGAVGAGAADAIASDDVASVVVLGERGAVAVVADHATETTLTGGAPVLEQAISALKLDLAVRPIPLVPDRAEDLTPFAALLVDDPPGFTPEQRHALARFLEAGGTLLVALGPRAAAAPLGATLEPLLSHAAAWGETRAHGAAPAAGALMGLGEAAESLGDLDAKARATLAPDDAAAVETLLAWDDGPPLVARRSIGRGAAWLTTLPFAVDTSDLPLRPGFLSLLDGFLDEARSRATKTRTDVGAAWALRPGVTEIRGPDGAPVALPPDAHESSRFSPSRIGAYAIAYAPGEPQELRVAAPAREELDFRPRAVGPDATEKALGGGSSKVDVSWQVALALLLLVAIELGLRAFGRRNEEAGTPAAASDSSVDVDASRV